RDRRVRARRQTIVAATRRTGAPLRRADVRLQVVQVARSNRSHRPRDPGLLGGRGLRRQRVGRTQQRSRRSADVDFMKSKRRFPRFDRTERIVHWSNATIVLILIATGALLKFEGFEALVGRRLLIKDIHVYVGFLILVPILVGILI